MIQVRSVWFLHRAQTQAGCVDFHTIHGSTQVCTAGSHKDVEYERHIYEHGIGSVAARPRDSETLERASSRLQSHTALLLVHLFVFTYIASPPHRGRGQTQQRHLRPALLWTQC